MWIHVIKNNIFMLKYAFKYAKFNLFQRFIYSVLSVVPALVNVLLIKILIDSILGNCDWKIVLIIVSVSFMASMISTVTNSYILNIGNKKAALIIQQNMQENLMQKSRNIDMYNYDDPDFYDKYTLALNEAENRVSCRALGREIESKLIECIADKHRITKIEFKSTGKNEDIKMLLLEAFPHAVLTNCENA